MRFSLLLLCAGCDAALGISKIEQPPTTRPFDRCSAGSEVDEPLRYRVINAGFTPTPSWDDLRRACRVRGMDLLVPNDIHELGMFSDPLPGWIGVSQTTGGQWESIDGCPVAVQPGASVAGGAMCGVLMSPLEISGTACDGMLVPTEFTPDRVLGGWCETPRPDTAACLPADPRQETYAVSSEPLTYAGAKSFCEGMGLHLLVLSSSAELPIVDAVPTRAWIGARFDGDTWKTDTGCPGLYPWTDLGPVLADNVGCVATEVAPDAVTQLPHVIGVATAGCSEQHIAICESD